MSVYKTIGVNITDMDVLAAVLDELGIPYIYDPEGNLKYYKWQMPGRPRGADATIVIGRLDGGLDRTPRHYCGDTAFCQNADGTWRVELDIAHGDAPLNWSKIQSLYSLRLAEKNLPRGMILESWQMDPHTGVIEAVVKDTRRSTRSSKAARRQMARRRA